MLRRTGVRTGFIVLIGMVAIAIGPGCILLGENGQQKESIYAFNVSDDRKRVGSADNVFIGEVIKKTGSQPNTPPPEADSPGFSPQGQFSGIFIHSTALAVVIIRGISLYDSNG